MAGVFIGLLVIGPACAVVLSPLFGIVAVFRVGSAKASFERQLMRTWHDEVLEKCDALHGTLTNALLRRRKLLFDRIERFEQRRSFLPDDLFA